MSEITQEQREEQKVHWLDYGLGNNPPGYSPHWDAIRTLRAAYDEQKRLAEERGREISELERKLAEAYKVIAGENGFHLDSRCPAKDALAAEQAAHEQTRRELRGAVYCLNTHTLDRGPCDCDQANAARAALAPAAPEPEQQAAVDHIQAMTEAEKDRRFIEAWCGVKPADEKGGGE